MPSIDYRIVYPYLRTAASLVPRPMVAVVVRNPGYPPVPVVALVDSGADVSTFHLNLATNLGIDLAGCRVSGIRGVGGQALTYIASVELELEGRRFSADVRFTSSIPPTTALLGRHDVFEHFQFGFDQRGRRLFIEPYS